MTAIGYEAGRIPAIILECRIVQLSN